MINDNHTGWHWQIWTVGHSGEDTWKKQQILHSAMNSAVQLVFSSSRYDHITPLLWQLYWLTAIERIQFSRSQFMYTSVYMEQHCCTSPMSSSARPISSSGDTYTQLSHWQSLSLIVHRTTQLSDIGNTIRPSLLPLPVLGTVYPNMCSPPT